MTTQYHPPPYACPSCHADLGYEEGGKRYSRVFGIYDQGRDRTVAWACPFCGHQWPREP